MMMITKDFYLSYQVQNPLHCKLEVVGCSLASALEDTIQVVDGQLALIGTGQLDQMGIVQLVLAGIVQFDSANIVLDIDLFDRWK
jgi:hypothetical protein